MFGKGDLDHVGRAHTKVLEVVFRHAGSDFTVKLNEGDVRLSWDQTNLLEAGESWFGKRFFITIFKEKRKKKKKEKASRRAHCWNRTEIVSSLVSSGRFCTNKILLGGREASSGRSLTGTEQKKKKRKKILRKERKKK